MSTFCGPGTIVKMTFLVLLRFFCFETPAAAAAEILELSGREDLTTWCGYGEENLSTVLIRGKILCHANRHKKTPFPSCPVSGAQVAVLCSTSRKIRNIWAKGTSDGYGVFLVELPSHLHAVPNLEKRCLVKVFHLPKGCACRRGKKIELTSVSDGVRTYTANSIHLMAKLFKARITGAAKPDKMVNYL